MTQQKISAKITLIGEGNTGKSSMLHRLMSKDFTKSYRPTIFEHFEKDILIKNKPITLEIWDTAGQEDYDRLMPLNYPNTEILIICFSIANMETYKRVKHKWIPEINHYSPNTSIVLVGCKTDLRYDSGLIEELVKRGESCISSEMGRELCSEIKGMAYFECSALENKGVNEVFEFCASVVYKRWKKKNKCKALKKVWENITKIFD